MFEFGVDDQPASKCYVTHGSLPVYIDSRQPPTRKKPFSTILDHTFAHTLELVLPEDLFHIVWEELVSKVDRIQYAKVFLPLSALLEGEFFNIYIKSGNILMFSEGRPGVDNVFSLADGILRLELNKESYERAGLVGKAIRDGTRKHVKTRYAVEINLRLPSMLHGKKGFERIVWAFKNVLNSTVTWLFHDCEAGGKSSDAEQLQQPILRHHPIVRTCDPNIAKLASILVPPLAPPEGDTASHRDDFEDYAADISEWLGLLALDSPRVQAVDSIDAYLSRYEVPSRSEAQEMNLVRIRWRGLLSAKWITRLFLECIRCTTRQSWFFLSVSGSRLDPLGCHNGYTILRLSEQQPTRVMDTERTETKAGGGNILNNCEQQRQYVVWDHVGAFDSGV